MLFGFLCWAIYSKACDQRAYSQGFQQSLAKNEDGVKPTFYKFQTNVYQLCTLAVNWRVDVFVNVYEKGGVETFVCMHFLQNFDYHSCINTWR